MARLVAVLLLVVAPAACSVSRPASGDTGEEICRKLCANCHGEGLEGSSLGQSLGPGSMSASQPDSYTEFAIVNGKGAMPSFEQVLEERQVERLIEYIREVQAG